MTVPPGGESPNGGETLIVLFLRGAADALNMVVPHGEAAYYALRPTLGIAHPDDARTPAEKRAIDLDGFFGLHPALRPLHPAWQAGHLAIVHACGAPDESHSHFKAQELMERGVAEESGPASGWLGRCLATSSRGGGDSPLRAIAWGELSPRSLRGAVPVTVLRSLADFHLAGDPRALAQLRAALVALYSTDDPLGVIGRETLQLLDTLQTLSRFPDTRFPDTRFPDTPFPDTPFGRGLSQIARLIRADVGLEVAALDLGGWDTHFAQGVIAGPMPNLMQELAEGLAAFHADLLDYADRLTVVVMTEFGRRARENGSLGTDHGHGALMLLLGGNVAGGQVHGRWPGLEEGQLVGPGDLAVTTDYRDVLAEVCLKRLGNPALDQIFPGHAVEIRNLVR